MQQYLITTDEVSALSRGMSIHLDPDKIETYIRESENIYIKSALGDNLYLDVKENPEKYILLLDGGTYETKYKEKRLLTGLRVALAYYTYAYIVKNGDGNVSRFGFVSKEGEYSKHTEFKEKMMVYNDACSIADRYLKECVLYLKECEMPLYNGGGKLKSNRTIYRIIGE